MPRLDQIRFSTLDLAPIRDDGSPAQALHNSLALARHVEGLGFERFWVAEHHNMDGIASSATSVLIGYLAAGTSRIRVGAGGVMLSNHSPLVIAEQFGTLETLYPGRIDLGLGRAPGTDRYTMQALRRNRSSDDDDEFPADVAQVRALLGPPQPNQRVFAIPGTNTRVPLWLLGSSLFSAQLAASMGLPYAFASHFAPLYVHEAIRLYRDQFQPSEALDKPYVMLGVPLYAADSDERAEYLATTAFQRVLALLRSQSRVLRPPIKSMQGVWLPHEQDAVGNFLGMALIGGPRKVRARLEVLLEQTRADELIFTNDMYEPNDRHRAFEIVAQLRSA
ncbi:LLM class flavin-dependent oxidoreductase [Azomonas macrocytogenes]|uniref:Luciferase-like monooxygenase n=1 Tax=Azomonas macrocytogenes TaxID=69962 RepID=A0A839T2E5_AZOMA|nr:LLM class flavin-dependent oxidoreductase [Azomonas macrocytogenes]MBB3103278.1 luciferase family oxidoreductase group 1 [Azomonas macrocytogenes]